MFWGNSSTEPDQNQSGLYNVGLLELAQIQHHLQRYFVLMNFPNLTTVFNANYMHEYKKQLRAMLRVIKWYPQIVNTSSPYEASLSTVLTTCYHMLDVTHKSVVPYLYYVRYGSPAALAKAEVDLDIAFLSMKTWLIEHAWVDQLHLFAALILLQ